MKPTWKVLLVDDDESTHMATKIQFKRLKISGKEIEFLSAFSAKEALETLRQNPSISLMIVDVIMEDDSAGLKLIRQVREELKNKRVRIIIRSGCLDLIERITSKDYPIHDKGDCPDQLKDMVIEQIKKYKLMMWVKIIVIKMVIDLIKKLF